ncbi:hypothetical protein EBR57_01605 [bacterium]|nr:hypothetical protein [bacterium]
MITISTSPRNVSEVKYVLDIIFTERFKLDYRIDWIPGATELTITLPNSSTIKFNHDFFDRVEENNYISPKNLPQAITYATHFLFPEDTLPIIYGTTLVSVEEKSVKFGFDIVATIFFMLTRWEEVLSNTFDKHTRARAEDSVSRRFNFLHRPIVDEYIEVLKSAIQFLCPTLSLPNSIFSALITHDVDELRRWRKPLRYLKDCFDDIRGIKTWDDVQATIARYITAPKDPYDTFDYIMNLSEQNGLASHFFFMSGGSSDLDNRYSITDSETTTLIGRIRTRNHVIGFHPSYNAYIDSDQFTSELELLRSVTPHPILSGRQHYLRFKVPDTWQIWENEGLEWDSTLLYADTLGFRAGTCHPFSVFNCNTRTHLTLKEIPLTVMESIACDDMRLSADQCEAQINSAIDVVKKYNGTFVLLWHNSYFQLRNTRKYMRVYENTVRRLGQLCSQS